MVQCAGRMFEIFFEEDEVTIRCCIAPPEKVWYMLNPYDKRWSREAATLPRVDLILANPTWSNGKVEIMDFGIKEIKPRYGAMWIPQRGIEQAFQYMKEAGYEPVHSWTWLKMTPRGKIRGALGKLFQR
eukprot:snap_masked-scaffold_11-processed-gene-9.18-mRNA-1 protein AED:1.00 eAED:1.00 QI:0/-1/0/0/-1/1/1/0/128